MRTKEEKAYLVLQHLYEMLTEKDPTGVDPYVMEIAIIKVIDNAAEEIGQELIKRLDKEFGDDTTTEVYETLLKVFESLKKRDK